MGSSLLALLALLGFLRILLLAGGVAALGASIVAAALLARRHRAQLVARQVASRLGHAFSRVGVGVREHMSSQSPRVRDLSARVRAAGGRHLQGSGIRSAASLVHAPAKAWPTRTPVVCRREALRANAAGARLRREGAYLEAAEQHHLALALFRDLGDRRSEALTLNNLALALDRAGDISALDLFEEAATILGDLGEEQCEGEVIANLGLAFRRRGRDEQSAKVLEIALGKLDPESQAYRKVERLRRAS